MKQQTAVDWLFDQLTSTWYDTNSCQDILKQAKEMEKEQIIKAHKLGFYYKLSDLIVTENSEKYYNQIYTDGTI